MNKIYGEDSKSARDGSKSIPVSKETSVKKKTADKEKNNESPSVVSYQFSSSGTECGDEVTALPEKKPGEARE